MKTAHCCRSKKPSFFNAKYLSIVTVVDCIGISLHMVFTTSSMHMIWVRVVVTECVQTVSLFDYKLTCRVLSFALAANTTCICMLALVSCVDNGQAGAWPIMAQWT